MNDEEAQFVEEMGQVLASYGMTPMAGRMWGWLLICEPQEQTAAELSEALHASRGAISGTARILAGAGFIKRTTRRGDRREYFSAQPEALEGFLRNAGQVYARFRILAEKGLEAIRDHSPPSKERLEELRDLFGFVEREMPVVINRFLDDRAAQRRRAG